MQSPFMLASVAGIVRSWAVVLAVSPCIRPAWANQPPPPEAQQQAAPAGLPPQPTREERIPSVVEMLRREAGRVIPLLTQEDARRFAFSVTWLSPDMERTVYVRQEPRSVLTHAEWEALGEPEREGYEAKTADQYYFYYTNYGSPLGYARALDVLCARMSDAVKAQNPAAPSARNPLRGTRILDFGFGSIGPVRMLASIGAHVTGVDVDPFLRAVYSEPDDQGEVPPTGIDDNKPGPGSLTLAFGRWPAEPSVVERVGEGFDVVLSKNTLKRGYITPTRPTDPRRLIDLGVPREEFLGHVHRILNPGGWFFIYNVCPAQSPEDQPYLPHADGQSPWSREELIAAGFEVMAFDEDDSATMRQHASALGWDAGVDPINLQDLHVWFTLVRKPAAVEAPGGR